MVGWTIFSSASTSSASLGGERTLCRRRSGPSIVRRLPGLVVGVVGLEGTIPSDKVFARDGGRTENRREPKEEIPRTERRRGFFSGGGLRFNRGESPLNWSPSSSAMVVSGSAIVGSSIPERDGLVSLSDSVLITGDQTLSPV